MKGLSAHVLTGPIYVDGAEPGDMLEVRIHKFDLRVPYGVNNSGPRTGVLGDLLSAPTPKIMVRARAGPRSEQSPAAQSAGAAGHHMYAPVASGSTCLTSVGSAGATTIFAHGWKCSMIE